MGGDPSPQPTQEATRDVLAAYTEYLPQLANAAAGAISPIEQARLASAKNISPQTAALNQLLYETYGPQAARTSSEINKQNMLAAAEAENAVLESQGGKLGKNYLDFANLVDPEYFKTRASAGEALNNMLSPNLTGGEREEVQRAVNRSNEQRGTATAPSKLSTVENAMTFGSALRDRLGKALQLTGTTLPSFRSGITPQGIGSTAAANAGESHFTGVQNPSNNAFDLSNNFLQSVTGLQQQTRDIESKKRDSLDRFNETWGSVVGSL